MLLDGGRFLGLMLLQHLHVLHLVLLDLGTLQLSLAVGLHLLLLEGSGGILGAKPLSDLGLAQVNDGLALLDLVFLHINLLFVG